MAKFDRYGNLATSGYLYFNDDDGINNYVVKMLFVSKPVYWYDNLYVCSNNGLYSNKLNNEIIVDELIAGEKKYILNKIYLADNDKNFSILYINLF